MKGHSPRRNDPQFRPPAYQKKRGDCVRYQSNVDYTFFIKPNYKKNINVLRALMQKRRQAQ